MSEKTLNTRIQQKHDIEINWSKAVNFIPKIGEVIVYDPDENHAVARVKIGDGVKTVVDLAFIDDAAKAVLFKKIDMVDEKVEALGQLVGDVSIPEQIEEALLKTQADWNEIDENNPAYVKNKTHYSIDHSIVWDGNADELTPVKLYADVEYYKMSDYVPTRQELIGQTYTFTEDGSLYPYTITSESFDYIEFLFDIYIVDHVIAIVTKDDALSQAGLKLAKGIYFAKPFSKNIFISSLSLPIEVKQLDEKYIPTTIARTQDVAIADWNINDENDPAYIKNRTHYEKSGIFWDGNTEGLIQSKMFSRLDDYFYKIADYTPTPEELIGHTVKFYDGSEMEGIIDEQTSISMFENNNYIVYIGPYAVMAVATVADEDFGAPSPGLYFYYISDDYYTFYCSYLSELKQLDEKFIPNSIARTDDLPIAITLDRIDEICGIEPVMTLVVDEDGDAVINAGFPDDEGNLTI